MTYPSPRAPDALALLRDVKQFLEYRLEELGALARQLMTKREAARIHKRTRELKKAYGALYTHLLELFRTADPIGIGSAAPADEYSPEVGTVLPRLASCKDADDVQRVLHEEFCTWFDPELAGPAPSYRILAVQVWRAFTEHGRGV